MSSKVVLTDIPESAFVSHGLGYRWLEARGEQLASLWAASPLAAVDRVECPVMLAISKWLLTLYSPLTFLVYHSFFVLSCSLLSFFICLISSLAVVLHH